jgi:hypothetical protein
VEDPADPFPDPDPHPRETGFPEEEAKRLEGGVEVRVPLGMATTLGEIGRVTDFLFIGLPGCDEGVRTGLFGGAGARERRRMTGGGSGGEGTDRR